MNSDAGAGDTDAKAEADSSDDRRRRREEVEHRSEDNERSLTDSERERAHDARRLSARTVYAVVMAEGEEELSRPLTSLLWSGVAAGIAISTSVLAEGILQYHLADHAYAEVLVSMGYTVGFILVILSRLQLFTENTLSVVLPVLFRPSRENFGCTARLWTAVFLANMVGTALAAGFLLIPGLLPPGTLQGVAEVARSYAEVAGWEALFRGVPAGFLIAGVVWMLPSARGSEIWVIFLFTYLIALGGFTHVVAGATEVYLLVFLGELSIWAAVGLYILPTLLGNIIGGTVLFAMLAHAQVSEEL
ncbi:formate/nitrite transporter family protein [Rhodobacteraceae bacterium 2CG4]|uniref:Formate/nitrite transporter family protein n=1 Tax=Halovulum marinum TaxID=2662447 RepID=A0A6L5Z448_9RHOB|nr:formate/nitrite transporter family protein [Halovulum marinum]MSU91328.1 formate/nitrite transporter family protein [Halovulum marinum]